MCRHRTDCLQFSPTRANSRQPSSISRRTRATRSKATARSPLPRARGLPLGRDDLALQPGHYLRIVVADTGAGMDGATINRAMEPFFTTKGPGKGTGLGLPVARGFAHQSGGALKVESAVGRGTSVSIWLPSPNRMPSRRSRKSRRRNQQARNAYCSSMTRMPFVKSYARTRRCWFRK